MSGREKYIQLNLVSGPSHLEVETATAKLKSVNLQVVIKSNQIQIGSETLVSAIHNLINSIGKKIG
jgi:hypothetical protein